MATILGILFVGFLSGLFLRYFNFATLLRQADRTVMPVLYLLLMVMGIWVGENQEVMNNLTWIGWSASVLSVGSIAGSIVFTKILALWIVRSKKKKTSEKQEIEAPEAFSGVKATLWVLGFFVIGGCAGYFGQEYWVVRQSEEMTLYVLYVLLFLVGATLGGDRSAWKMILGSNPRTFVLPVATAMGSLVGGALSSFFLLNVDTWAGMAVGAGFGYYSLSSVIIAKLWTSSMGVIALLSNIFREIITLLFAPRMARWFGPLAPIASGGATSMDTTLPVITFASGREYAVLAVFHGIILSVAVPIVIPILFEVSRHF